MKAKENIMPKTDLWDQLKEDLERWARQGGFDKPSEMTKEQCETMLEVMQKREEQSYGR